MTFSQTTTDTASFTITHARYLASKVATDLKRLQRFYGQPSDKRIEEFEEELCVLLRGGYLDTVMYGFQRSGRWIEPALRYIADELNGVESADDDPGRVFPGADTSGASFSSFLTYSSSWYELTSAERQKIKESLPMQRTTGSEPDIDGELKSDQRYSTGGRALQRFNVRSTS